MYNHKIRPHCHSFFFLLLIYNSYTRKFITLKHTNEPFFTKFKSYLQGSCSHYQYLIPEHFYHPIEKFCTHNQPAPIPPLLAAPSNHESTFCVYRLENRYECYHTMCGLLRLASFAQHVFMVHSSISMCQCFITLYGRTLFHYVDIPPFVDLFLRMDRSLSSVIHSDVYFSENNSDSTIFQHFSIGKVS